jgi:hypothetical protein
VVRIFEDIAGGRFDLEFVSAQALEGLEKAGEDSWVRSLAGLRRCYADGDVISMQGLQERFPMNWTTVREYARSVLSA